MNCHCRIFTCIQAVLVTALSTSAGQEMSFVEVCCSPQSSLRAACRVARMPYIGITQDVQNPKILEEVVAFVGVQRSSHRWVHVHCSTPCSSGLKNLTQQVDETA